MPGECRMVLDVWVGTCHGVPIVGYALMGAATVYDNDMPVIRTTDLLMTSCPICGAGYVVDASPDVFAEDLGITRLGDFVAYSAGSGQSGTGSPDVFSND